MVKKIVAKFLLGNGEVPAYYHRGNIFPKNRILNPETHCITDGRMVHEDKIDFYRCNFLSPFVDQFLFTAGEIEIPLRIKVPDISCPEPAVSEQGGIFFRRIVIPCEDDVTSDGNLSFFKWFAGNAVLIQNS
jgi:hypothetical protein